jgi:hypothetical protein
MTHPTSNNQVGLDQVKTACTQDDIQSPNKETLAGMTQVHNVAPITH